MPYMPNERHPDDDLLRIGEAADLLQVSTETIRNWTKQGKLSAVQTPGGHRRYRRADVVAALKPVVAPAAASVA